MVDSRMLSIVAACAMGLCFIFYVVSNAVPSWGQVSGGAFTVGLWQTCAQLSETKVCNRLSCPSGSGSICGKIHAARAFMTLACIVSAFAVVLLLLMIFAKNSINNLLLMVSKILPFICLLMGILGVALGTSATTGSQFEDGYQLELGAAAIVGIVALVINFAAGVMAFFIKADS